MSAILDWLGCLIAAAVDAMAGTMVRLAGTLAGVAGTLAGGAPTLLLATFTLTLVAVATLALVVVTCRYHALPTSEPGSARWRDDSTRPVLVTQSNPNAAGRIRSRAPNRVLASA